MFALSRLVYFYCCPHWQLSGKQQIICCCAEKGLTDSHYTSVRDEQAPLRSESGKIESDFKDQLVGTSGHISGNNENRE